MRVQKKALSERVLNKCINYSADNYNTKKEQYYQNSLTCKKREKQYLTNFDFYDDAMHEAQFNAKKHFYLAKQAKKEVDGYRSISVDAQKFWLNIEATEKQNAQRCLISSQKYRVKRDNCKEASKREYKKRIINLKKYAELIVPVDVDVDAEVSNER